MQSKYRAAFSIAVFGTVLLTAGRILLMPYVIAGTVPNSLQTGLLAFTLIVLAVILFLCGIRPDEGKALERGAVRMPVFGMLLTAVLMTFSAVFAFFRWAVHGEMPFPQKITVTAVDKLLFYLLVLFLFLGGVFFFCLAFVWFTQRRSKRGILAVAALAPIVWIWLRLGRYETSYVSSLNLFRNLYDIFMLVAEMLFFLSFARYVSRVEEKPGRLLVGTALCTGMLAASGVLVRGALLITGNKDAAQISGLIASPDLGIAVLAFVFAYAQAHVHRSGPDPEDENGPLNIMGNVKPVLNDPEEMTQTPESGESGEAEDPVEIEDAPIIDNGSIVELEDLRRQLSENEG